MPKIVPYTKGSVIFFAGDKDERIFILQSGSVILSSEDLVTGEAINEQLNPGEFFGVKSALARRPRMETANAKTDVQTVMLTSQEFEKIFSVNKEIVSKMLLAFNKTLNELGGKTERLLNYDRSAVNPQEGMLACAKAFFEAEQYHSCVTQCKLILAEFPENPAKAEVESLLADASLKEELQKRDSMNYLAVGKKTQTEAEKSALRQFSLPVFERFSREYDDGTVLISEFAEPRHFYFLLSGEVVVKKCLNGVLKNLEVIEAGNFFGVRAIISGTKRDVCCVAKGKIKCLEFVKENFNAIIRDNPQISTVLLKFVCKRVYDERYQLSILNITDISARIANIFLMYNDMFYVAPEDNDGEISFQRKFPVTVEDVAQWAAISNDNARDELNKYVSRNKVAIYDSYMIISNIMDMKRTVDSYFANKDDDAGAKQPAKGAN